MNKQAPAKPVGEIAKTLTMCLQSLLILLAQAFYAVSGPVLFPFRVDELNAALEGERFFDGVEHLDQVA